MDSPTLSEPDGRSDAARRLRVTARSIARTRQPVLVTGEMGTGKLRFARLLHELSERPQLPFRRLFCNEDPSEFSSFIQDAPSGATLVFEHIDEAPGSLQRHIARSFANSAFLRNNIRVIATTRRDLATEVVESRFLPDLYFRLRVHSVDIAPLRERKEDIPTLAATFLEELARTRGCESPELTAEAVDVAEQYHWPGNVRQLHNELLRCAARAQRTIGRGLLAEGLDDRIAPVPTRAQSPTHRLQERVLAFEKQVLQEALASTLGNRDRAANLLGITRRTLQRKLALHRTMGGPVEIPLRRMQRSKASDEGTCGAGAGGDDGVIAAGRIPSLVGEGE